jgi:hypothetical protein
MAIERMKERLQAIQARIPAVRGRGEEATKQALVLPMLETLGYDIWNPGEVCPEYEADFAVKKQGQKEKVDLAVLVGPDPRMFIEVKPIDQTLDGHQGQLARYFNGVPTVSLGILTNGIEYRFFTDSGEPNLLDPHPFFTLRLDAPDFGLDVLSRFHKAQFSPGGIRDYATELNYTQKITQFLRSELDLRTRDPGDALVRWVLASENVFEGRAVASVVERFRPIVKNALHQVLRDVVRRSFVAMDEGVAAPEPAPEAPAVTPIAAPVEVAPTAPSDESTGRTPVTTAAELAAFDIIKAQFDTSVLATGRIYDATLKREVPIEIAHKDTTGYFGIYFNKPAWWFARLQLDSKQPWVVVNVTPAQAVALLPAGVSLLPATAFGDVRIPIRSPEDLHSLNRVLIAAMIRTVDERRLKPEDVPS